MDFEKYAYEYLLDRALKNVPDDLDKRESSPIFAALAPCCLELSKAYQEMKTTLNQFFAETAERKYLILRAKERGIEPFSATKNIKKAEFRDIGEELMDVDIGLRFSTEEYTFLTKEKLSKGVFLIECEQPGDRSNFIVGELLPVDTIPNLGSIKIVENVKLGSEEESTQHLRERYFAKVREPATSGNVAHYKLWTMEVPGVGGVKVFPLHAGAGTVKLIIVDSKMQAATTELIREVKEHIEEVRPIGATVTVESATKKVIVVSVKVKTIKGADLQTIKSRFSEALKSYFKAVSFNDNYISIAKIGSVLLSIPDVLDHTDLKLNSQTGNVELLAEEIPFLSSLEVEVIP